LVDASVQYEAISDEGIDPTSPSLDDDDDSDASNDSADFKRDGADGFFTTHSAEDDDFDPLCLRCNIPAHYVSPGTFRELKADTRLRAVWKRRRNAHLAECLGNERQSRRTFEDEESDCLQTVGTSMSVVGQAVFMTPELEQEIRSLLRDKYEGLDRHRQGEAKRRVLSMIKVTGELRGKLKEKRLTPFEVCQFQEVRARVAECSGQEPRQELLDLAALYHWTCQTNFDTLTALPLA